MNDSKPKTMPQQHQEFLQHANEVLQADARIVGVAAGGSYLTDSMDEFSDLDLVVVVEPDEYSTVMAQRQRIAQSLGHLLASFTGEHVGEPRLLICLYGPPLLHVDLKFVMPQDLAQRVENPAILWERDGRLTESLQHGEAIYPSPDLQWMDERFWTWIHYSAGKIARGELVEAIDSISFLRTTVLGPLCLLRSGARPCGVRRIETAAPQFAEQMKSTISTYDAASCLSALRACVQIYRTVRKQPSNSTEVVEQEVMRYLDEIESSL